MKKRSMGNGSKDNFVANFSTLIRFNHLRFFADALTLSNTFFNTFMVFGYGAIGFWVVVPIYNYYFHRLPFTFPIAAWYAVNSDIFAFLPNLGICILFQVPLHRYLFVYVLDSIHLPGDKFVYRRQYDGGVVFF